MQPASLPLARSPLHAWHSAHGARLEEREGALLVLAYSGIEQEVAATKAGLGLTDLSVFAKVAAVGKGVPAFTESLLGEGPASQPRGVATFPGNGLDLACRLTLDHLLLLAVTPAATAFEEQLAKLSQVHDALVANVTAAYAGFELMGRDVGEVLRRVTTLDVAPTALPDGTCAETSLARVPGLLVRPPQTYLPSVRLYVSSDLGEYVWETLLEVGRVWGIAPVGLEAWRQFQQRTSLRENGE